MKVDGVMTRTIRALPAEGGVEVIDQTLLPQEYRWARLESVADTVEAISRMQVRGAPLLGVAAAYGLAIATVTDPTDAGLDAAASALSATRPTAVNLQWAVRRVRARLSQVPVAGRREVAWAEAAAIAEEDVVANQSIARHGLDLLRGLIPRSGERLQVLTHCNAGWLATVDWGTALAPVYLADAGGMPVHVWVSETRPRNQGLLTAWELAHQGIPHTVVADNAAGQLIRTGQVDAVLVGADRVAANGDVANKVGTYLKALACQDARVPCYVAAPASTVDLDCPCGEDIPIEERDGEEVRVVRGLGPDGRPGSVRQLPARAPVRNPAFDITPARLISAIITDRGACPATPDGLRGLGRTR